MQRDAQLGGDDAREGGLAQTRWAGEEQVVDRLLPTTGGLEHDREVLLQLGLPDEVVELPWPYPGIVVALDHDLDLGRLGIEELFSHVLSPPSPGVGAPA